MKIQAFKVDFSSESRPLVIVTTEISKLQLDNSFRNSLYSLLQSERTYSEILEELSGGRTNVAKNDLIYLKVNGILVVKNRIHEKEVDF